MIVCNTIVFSFSNKKEKFKVCLKTSFFVYLDENKFLHMNAKYIKF